nr:ribonuclease H-like domain-containing protein [Tanacetum cinerariifolium]
MHYRLSHLSQGILSHTPAIYASKPTTLPSMFSTMPLQDLTWHMDTGASSHLNFNASNLSTIFDKRLFPSVHVGDGKSIPVTNTGHSIIPSHHRPFHLHTVLVTPNIIKNFIYAGRSGSVFTSPLTTHRGDCYSHGSKSRGSGFGYGKPFTV